MYLGITLQEICEGFGEHEKIYILEMTGFCGTDRVEVEVALLRLKKDTSKAERQLKTRSVDRGTAPIGGEGTLNEGDWQKYQKYQGKSIGINSQNIEDCSQNMEFIVGGVGFCGKIRIAVI